VYFIACGFEHHAEVIANIALVIDNQNVNLRLSHWPAPLQRLLNRTLEHQACQLKKLLKQDVCLVQTQVIFRSARNSIASLQFKTPRGPKAAAVESPVIIRLPRE